MPRVISIQPGSFPWRPLCICLLAAFCSLFFFSPRLPVFTEPMPGTFEWTRGLNFLAQLAGASADMVEPALRHRSLPIIAAKILGLSGFSAFAIGWLGVLPLLAYVYFRARSLSSNEKVAVSAVFLFASTSSVITTFGWLGIFDSWWVLGLLVLALEPSYKMVAIASFLTPWIDERFLIGIPIAFLARWLITSVTLGQVKKMAASISMALIPYFVWRLYSYLGVPSDASSRFISIDFLQWVSMGPHGWWMAYRLSWTFLVASVVLPNASKIKPIFILAVFIPVAFVALATAADVSRSAMAAAPLLFSGVLLSFRANPVLTQRALPLIAIANFMVPFVHVVHQKMQAVYPLPWEIIRLIKKTSAFVP